MNGIFIFFGICVVICIYKIVKGHTTDKTVGIDIFGLVWMPDVYCRLQTATKFVTFGAGSILFGAFLLTRFSSIGLKALLCIVFLFFNSPTASHALSFGALNSGVKPVEGTEIEKILMEDKGR